VKPGAVERFRFENMDVVIEKTEEGRPYPTWRLVAPLGLPAEQHERIVNAALEHMAAIGE